MHAKYRVADVLNLESAVLKDIILNTWNLRALHTVRKFRSKELVGHLDWCMDCNKLHLHFNSYRNRHCPTCQGHKQYQWTEARKKELLPVPYFQVVFTLPYSLYRVAMEYP
tara:strand:+ start:5848 stop:6180 length:333 start_codon:yes stop_codon:yes gene_type:complete